MAGTSAPVSARVIHVSFMMDEDPFRSEVGRAGRGQATTRDMRETRALHAVALSAVINLTSLVTHS
ncbi:hypothetical protein GCM10022245_58580 [Streptomyces mayteni]